MKNFLATLFVASFICTISFNQLLAKYTYISDLEDFKVVVPYRYMEMQLNYSHVNAPNNHSVPKEDRVDISSQDFLLHFFLPISKTLDLSPSFILTPAGQFATLSLRYTDSLYVFEKDLFSLKGGLGYSPDHKVICLEASAIFINGALDKAHFFLQVETRATTDYFWYCAKANFQVISALGFGVRMQKDSFMGPYFQVGSDGFGLLWLGGGLEEKTKSLCVGLGFKMGF